MFLVQNEMNVSWRNPCVGVGKEMDRRVCHGKHALQQVHYFWKCLSLIWWFHQPAKNWRSL